MIVVGGHTRSIGKTQLVCDVISAFPRANWIAGKITQYGHGVCARNGENCDCAPDEHVCAIEWETRADTGTDKDVRHRITVADGKYGAAIPLIEQPHRGGPRRLYPQHSPSLHGGIPADNSHQVPGVGAGTAGQVALTSPGASGSAPVPR